MELKRRLKILKIGIYSIITYLIATIVLLVFALFDNSLMGILDASLLLGSSFGVLCSFYIIYASLKYESVANLNMKKTLLLVGLLALVINLWNIIKNII